MVTAIIVAAGKGARMRNQQRKQYLPLAEIPILVHTLNVFHGCERISQINLVIPQADFDYCRKNILSHLNPPHNIKLVAGGDRAREFEMRLEGASYEEIARAGGGIVSTVKASKA